MNILPNLNPLRFFLALLVMLFHIPQLSKNQNLPYFDSLPILQKGTIAVYMFFVLSGFLIIRIIYKNKNHFSIKNFYMRRMLRILPLYYLIVIFGFTFYNILLPYLGIPFEINYTIYEGLMLTVFFLPNIFAKYEPGGILEILWSIGIEEQFYLMIAPLFLLIRKKLILKTLIGILISYFIIFHLDFFYLLSKFNFVYFFMLSGGIIGILEQEGKLKFLEKHKWFSISIVSLTFLFFTTNLFSFDNSLLNNAFICVLFSLFIYTISIANFNITIKNKLLNYLGSISYGIYMYHVIAMNVVVFIFTKIHNKNFIPEFLEILLIHFSIITITILMSHLSYKYFESYFLKLKKRYRI